MSANHGMVEEAIDLDAGSSSSHDPYVTIVDGGKFAPNAENMRLSSNVDTSAPVASSSSLVSTGSMGSNDLDVSIVESQIKALNISNIPNSENQSYEEKLKHIYHNNLIQPQMPQQRNNPYEVPSANLQGVNSAYVGMEQSPLNPSKFSSDVQPLLQSSGFTPPLYATAAAYMTSVNPYYSNLQTSGMYPPQYVGGYTYNPSPIPPYVAAYSPHGAVPVVVDGATGSNFTPHTPGVSSGASISHGAEMVHANKFIGQYGYPLQPSFGDPMYMQYHQQPFVEGYGFSGNYDQLASRASASAQIGPYDSQKRASNVTYLDDKKLQHQQSGISMDSRRGGLMVPSYFGHPPNMGFVMQYPSSPVPSPVLSGYPEGGTGHPGRRNEIKFSPVSSRNGGVFSGWHGQRAFDSSHDSKIDNFLEELKSGKGRRFELSDIIGHIVEFRQVMSSITSQSIVNC